MSDPAAAAFEACQSRRRHKRGAHNALAFELDYEGNLVAPREDIDSGAYRPARAIAFIVDKPVKREIAAADFRGRVVHHLIGSRLSALFERELVFDSYACPVGKGTHMGIRRVDRFLKGFFMSSDRGILRRRLDRPAGGQEPVSLPPRSSPTSA